MSVRVKFALPRFNPGSVARLFQTFGEDLRPHRTRLAVSGAALLGESVITLLQPWPVKIVFDRVLMPSSRGSAGADAGTVLLLAAASVLVLTGTRGLLSYVYAVQSAVVGHRLVASIRLRVFSHVQRLPLSYHDYRETGDLMTRLTGDLSLLQDLLVTVATTVVSRLFLVVGMVAVIFWLDPVLGAVALGIIPCSSWPHSVSPVASGTPPANSARPTDASSVRSRSPWRASRRSRASRRTATPSIGVHDGLFLCRLLGGRQPPRRAQRDRCPRARRRHPDAHTLRRRATDDGLWQAEHRAAATARSVTARALVNAAGPWVQKTLAATGANSPGRVRLVKGSHIVVPRLHAGPQAFLLQNPDKRVVFVIPYEGDYSLIGTTDVVFEGDPGAGRDHARGDRLPVRAAGRFLRTPPTPADVVWSYAGVRPLYDDAEGNPSEITRDYVLELDAPGGTAPLLSVFGGKITTYRRLAEEALAKLTPELAARGRG